MVRKDTAGDDEIRMTKDESNSNGSMSNGRERGIDEARSDEGDEVYEEDLRLGESLVCMGVFGCQRADLDFTFHGFWR